MIYIWPDGTWCWISEYSDATYRFMGDDFLKISIPEWASNEDAAEIAKLVTESSSIPVQDIVVEYFNL